MLKISVDFTANNVNTYTHYWDMRKSPLSTLTLFYVRVWLDIFALIEKDFGALSNEISAIISNDENIDEQNLVFL